MGRSTTLTGRGLVLCSLAVSAGCSTTLEVHRVSPDMDKNPDARVGLPYNLRQPKFVVREIKPTPENDHASFQVDVELVPDPGERYAVRLSPACMTETDFTLDLGDQGTLTSINAQTREQLTPTIKALGKFVAAAIRTTADAMAGGAKAAAGTSSRASGARIEIEQAAVFDLVGTTPGAAVAGVAPINSRVWDVGAKTVLRHYKAGWAVEAPAPVPNTAEGTVWVFGVGPKTIDVNGVWNDLGSPPKLLWLRDGAVYRTAAFDGSTWALEDPPVGAVRFVVDPAPPKATKEVLIYGGLQKGWIAQVHRPQPWTPTKVELAGWSTPVLTPGDGPTPRRMDRAEIATTSGTRVLALGEKGGVWTLSATWASPVAPKQPEILKVTGGTRRKGSWWVQFENQAGESAVQPLEKSPLGLAFALANLDMRINANDQGGWRFATVAERDELEELEKYVASFLVDGRGKDLLRDYYPRTDAEAAWWRSAWILARDIPPLQGLLEPFVSLRERRHRQLLEKEREIAEEARKGNDPAAKEEERARLIDALPEWERVKTLRLLLKAGPNRPAIQGDNTWYTEVRKELESAQQAIETKRLGLKPPPEEPKPGKSSIRETLLLYHRKGLTDRFFDAQVPPKGWEEWVLSQLDKVLSADAELPEFVVVVDREEVVR